MKKRNYEQKNIKTDTVKEGATTCPVCGGKLIPIHYGMPGPEMREQYERGEIKLGGCIIFGGCPSVACSKCDREFQEA